MGYTVTVLGLLNKSLSWKSGSAIVAGVAILVAAGFFLPRFLRHDPWQERLTHRCDQALGHLPSEILLTYGTEHHPFTPDVAVGYRDPQVIRTTLERLKRGRGEEGHDLTADQVCTIWVRFPGHPKRTVLTSYGPIDRAFGHDVATYLDKLLDRKPDVRLDEWPSSEERWPFPEKPEQAE